MELFEDFPCSNDLLIIKRKRTNPSSSNSSNTTITSTEFSTCSEEDEDMANCLILLSGGGFPTKFQETDGKVGVYVYECKTCNRTFPSFQALGGHRASHKRPTKIAVDDTNIDRKKSRLETPTRDLEKEKNKPTKSVFAKNRKCKTHECSICGSEFGSGQALGGHMRRHRSVPVVITNSSMKSGTHIENDIVGHDVIEKSRNVFNLDLNLPAPSEDGRVENFPGILTNQIQRLVFSAAVPALVDCHY